MCKNDVFVAKICNCKIRCFLSRKLANARSALALRDIWRLPLARQLIAACITLYQLLNTNALNSKLLNSIVWCRRVLHFKTTYYFAVLFYPVTEKQTETQVKLKLASETCQQSPLNYYCDITGHWYWSWYWHCYWYWSQRCSREWMKHVDIARLLLSHSLCVQPPKWIRLVVSR